MAKILWKFKPILLTTQPSFSFSFRKLNLVFNHQPLSRHENPLLILVIFEIAVNLLRRIRISSSAGSRSGPGITVIDLIKGRICSTILHAIIVLTLWFGLISDQFKAPERLVHKAFRMCISDVYKGIGAGFTVTGTIQAGAIQPGEKVLIMPQAETANVRGKLREIGSHLYVGELIQTSIMH